MVLVRGACGQIGSRLCTLLRTAGPLAHNLAPLSLRCSIWPAWVLFLAPAVLSAQASSRPCSAWCLSQHARDALAAGRYADYLNYARKIAERAPDHPGVVYAVARGYALVRQPAAAFGWLSRLADLGATQDVDMDSAFAGLDTSAAFHALRARLSANRAPIVQGTPAFSLPDPDLLPEALARDPITDSWLVGSLAKRKIIRLAPNGTASDFASDPELLRVVGIHVDSARSLLWFATWWRALLLHCEQPVRPARRRQPLGAGQPILDASIDRARVGPGAPLALWVVTHRARTALFLPSRP